MNKQVLRTWKIIYGNWRYTFSLIIIAVVFYMINAIIQHQNYRTLTDFYTANGFIPSLGLLFNLTIGLKDTMYFSSFISLIIIGLLFGMLLTLVFYKTKALKKHGTGKKKISVVTSVGLFLGVAAPGCAACGVGLLALFGISAAALSFLPLQGLEISLAAIGLLAFSVFHTSKGLLECKTCQIQLNSDNIKQNE